MPASFALIESNTSGTGRLFAKAVQAAGLRPVLISSNPSRYPYALQDGIDTMVTNTDDVAAVTAACKRLSRLTGLSAVLTSSDYFVGTAATVAAHLGLSGPDPVAIEECRYKAAQYRTLGAAGVGIPHTREVTTPDAAVRAAAAIGYPVVLKPVEGSGSIGVRQCQDRGQVADHAELILARTHNERGTPLRRSMLVQQHIDGREFSVEVMFGVTVGVTRKHLGPLPWNVETGHDYPAMLSSGDYEELSDTAEKACKALGLTWGAAHVELRLAENEPCVIEVNPRLAGGFIPRLVQLVDRRDLITELVTAAAGCHDSSPKPPVTPKTAASIRFLLARRSGTFVDIAGRQEVSQTHGVVEMATYPALGAPLHMQGDFRDRVGHVMTQGDTSAAAVALADEMAARLTVLIGDHGDPEF